MICNQQRAECAQKRHSPECGFRSTHLIASSDEYARNIPRAMRPGWLARAAFYICAIFDAPVCSAGVPSVVPASRWLSAGRLVRRFRVLLLLLWFRRLRQIGNGREQLGIERLQIQLLCQERYAIAPRLCIQCVRRIIFFETLRLAHQRCVSACVLRRKKFFLTSVL